MVTWEIFIWFAVPAMILAAGAAVMSMCRHRSISIALAVCAASMLAVFICGLWISLERPPLRTMGETRLWYSFFALIAGLLTYVKWRYRWILSFSAILASVFMILNITRPEIHDQTMMPALQSGWFIPHVTVYMFSYSLLGCAFIAALVRLFRNDGDIMTAADTLVYIGTAFLTFGMLSGSLWAKEAWGHFWAWDPKETWALVTWLSYVLYIHLRTMRKGGDRLACILLIFGFICLQMCWWGVNYLPAAQDSMHIYNR